MWNRKARFSGLFVSHATIRLLSAKTEVAACLHNVIKFAAWRTPEACRFASRQLRDFSRRPANHPAASANATDSIGFSRTRARRFSSA